jgi:hypothetical protein
MRRLPTLGGGALWGGGIDNYALRYTDESDDHVYGGAGNDYTVRYDEGLDEIRNCERLRPF